jgi:peptide/nickel transport system permease protein
MAGLAYRRFLQAVPVLFGITVLSFVLIHLAPGDPVRTALGYQVPDATIRAARHSLGLDQPLLTQYLHFLGGAVRLDFGTSLLDKRDVAGIIGPRVLPSLYLIAYSIVVALAIALPLGIVAALKRDTWVDHLVRVVTMISYAMPQFWLALILVLILSVKLGLFPIVGYGDTPLEHLRSLTLPAATIGISIAPLLVRSLRVGLIEGLSSDFVVAARARGLGTRRIVLHHVLRNSLLSVLTVLGVVIGLLMGATVVVENVFSIPGVGSQLVRSVSQRDYSVVQALTLLIGVFVVVVSLVIDVLYGVVDPRVRA